MAEKKTTSTAVEYPIGPKIPVGALYEKVTEATGIQLTGQSWFHYAKSFVKCAMALVASDGFAQFVVPLIGDAYAKATLVAGLAFIFRLDAMAQHEGWY